MKTRTKFVIGGAVIFAVIAALSVQGLQELTVVQMYFRQKKPSENKLSVS